MTEQQRQIDFRRCEQVALLNDLSLEAQVVGGQKVSTRTLKATLNAIDSFGTGGQCFASQETIARRTGISRRAIQLAIRALLDLGLMTVDLRRSLYGLVTNHYQIVWSELAVRNLRKPTAPIAVEFGPPVAESDAHLPATDAQVVQTDAQVVQTDAQVVQTDAHLGAHKVLNQNLKPPPPYPPPMETPFANSVRTKTAAADVLVLDPEPTSGGMFPPREPPWEPEREPPWEPEPDPIGAALRDIGLGFWRKLAVEFAPLGREAVLDAIATYKANVGRLSGPGSVVAYLRHGAWPRDDLVSPARATAIADREAVERERRRHESQVTTFIRDCRRRRMSDEQIESELAARGWEWV